MANGPGPPTGIPSPLEEVRMDTRIITINGNLTADDERVIRNGDRASNPPVVARRPAATTRVFQ